MRILLIHPPSSAYEKPIYCSFGILYIAQKLLGSGYDVEILDIDAHKFSKPYVSKFLEKGRYDIIGIGGLVMIYSYLSWLIPELRRTNPGKEIILGGGIASSLREKCFERFDIDYAVIGEGEITIVELLKEIENGRKFSLVKGIGFRSNGEVVFTEPRPLMPTLDDVPMVDETLFPLRKFIKNAKGFMTIHVQRGCPGSCTFCFNSFRVVASKVRYRPADQVVDEIEIFNEKYDIKLFFLTGECITLNREWIINFSKALLERGLNIKYSVSSRVNTIDEERLQWLQKSGCVEIFFGVETGSEKILKLMKKGANLHQARQAVSLAKKYIPKVVTGVVLGYMGEDKGTLKESVDFFKELGELGAMPTISLSLAFPGTELYQKALEKGRIKNEEKYLMTMDELSIHDYQLKLNLTEMPDEEAKREIASAIEKLTW